METLLKEWKKICKEVAHTSPLIPIHHEVKENKYTEPITTLPRTLLWGIDPLEDLKKRMNDFDQKNEYDFSWFALSGTNTPVEIQFKTRIFLETGRKEVDVSYKTKEINVEHRINILKAMKQLTEEVKNLLKKLDKERLRRVTEGKVIGQEFYVNYPVDYSLLTEQSTIFTEEGLEETIEVITEKMVHFSIDSKGITEINEVYLVGKRGKQIADCLNEMKLTEFSEVEDELYKLNMSFPFHPKKDKEKLLSSFFNEAFIKILNEKGLYILYN